MKVESEVLQQGAIELLGQLAQSSNETFLVELTYDDAQHWAIYKPNAELGERPLADFPPGLHRRERAAYLLSEALGWGIVPTTIIRDLTGLSVPARCSTSWSTTPTSMPSLCCPAPLPLRESPILTISCAGSRCLYLITNNADRKAGHVLRGDDEHLWAIDHGLCFVQQNRSCAPCCGTSPVKLSTPSCSRLWNRWQSRSPTTSPRT